MAKSNFSSRTAQPAKRNIFKSWLLWLSLLAIVVVVALLEITNTTHLFHKTATPPVIPVETSSNQPASQPAEQTGEDNTSSKNSGSPTTSTSNPDTSLPLKEPFGDFVSNHHPNLSGQPAPSKETSVCNTTPGATCYIRFTKGSQSTSLPTQKVNSSGTTYWTWDVKKAGLTAGDWTITAVASQNGSVKTTQDKIALSVSQ